MGIREASVRETVDQETLQCLGIVVIACFQSAFLNFIAHLFSDEAVSIDNVGIRCKIGVATTRVVALFR